MALEDLLMHLQGGITAAPSEPSRAPVEPLVLELWVPPSRPPKFRIQYGKFTLLAFGETRSGARGRFAFPGMSYAESRELWHTLRARGIEVEWVRAERIPSCPAGVVDVQDLAELWRVAATTPREQLSLNVGVK